MSCCKTALEMDLLNAGKDMMWRKKGESTAQWTSQQCFFPQQSCFCSSAFFCQASSATAGRPRWWLQICFILPLPQEMIQFEHGLKPPTRTFNLSNLGRFLTGSMAGILASNSNVDNNGKWIIICSKGAWWIEVKLTVSEWHNAMTESCYLNIYIYI